MDQIYNFFIGNTANNYVEVGFSDREAQAMAWIADQKPKGKFLGVVGGSFLALSWGHWHHKIFGYYGIKCNKLYTQLAILGVPFPSLRSRSSSEITSPASPGTAPTSTSPTTFSSTTTSSQAT